MLERWGQQLNKLRKELGEWLRQGKTTEETTQLLKSSMTLSKVGAMESATATELLTSTLNGYKLEAQDAMDVVDAISSIDLEAATSSEELAVALSRTANSANDAGVSFNKLLGMIGTTSSVTRKSASTIGESFKTIFARMSNVAAGKDIDDDGETLNDVEGALNRQGIALRKSQHEWRNFEDVLDEVAEKWDKFNSTQKSQVATAIAGTRQQENFRAMMNNWNEVTRLTGVAANSTGSATERMGVYLDSIEAKTNQLKASWEGFISSLQQSDSLKGIYDFLINLLDKLQYVDWGEIVKVLAAFTALAGVAKAIQAISGIVAAIKTAMAASAGIAGVVSTISGMLPTLLLIAGVVTAIAVAWKNVENNSKEAYDEAKTKLSDIKEEKKNVDELTNKYKNLYSKSKTSGLNDNEKKELQKVSSILVEQYGLEYDSIDQLTGAYKINENAIRDYYKTKTEELEKYQQAKKDNFEATIAGEVGEFQQLQGLANSERNKKDSGLDYDNTKINAATKKAKEITNQITSEILDGVSGEYSELAGNYIGNIIGKGLDISEDYKNKATGEYISKATTFVEKYNQSFNKVLSEIQAVETEKDNKGLQNLTDVEKYYEKLMEQKALIDKMYQERLLNEKEYSEIISNMEEQMSEEFEGKLLGISQSLGENGKEFNDLANKVLGLDSQLKNNQITIDDYIVKLNELDDALDMTNTFNNNREAAVQYFSALGDKISSLFQNILTSYNQGELENEEYFQQLLKLGDLASSYGDKFKNVVGYNANQNNYQDISDDVKKQRLDVQKEVSNILADKQAADAYGEWRQGFESASWIEKMQKAWFDSDWYDDFKTENQSKYKDGMWIRDGHTMMGSTYNFDNVDNSDYLKKTYSEEALNLYKQMGEELSKVSQKAYTDYLSEHHDEEWEVRNANAKQASQEAVNSKISEFTSSEKVYGETEITAAEAIEAYSNKIVDAKNRQSAIQQQINDLENKQKGLIANNAQNAQERTANQAEINKLKKEEKKVTKEVADNEEKLARAQGNAEDYTDDLDKALDNVASSTQKIGEYQDSCLAIQKIMNGEIVQGTDAWNEAANVIGNDLYLAYQNADDKTKELYQNTLANIGDLTNVTAEQLSQAVANGEITVGQAKSIMQNEMKTAIEGLRDAVGDFFIYLGQAFSDFSATIDVKVKLNDGLRDALWSAIVENKGTDLDLGEITASGDMSKVAEIFSGIGNAIKNIPVNFDIGGNKDGDNPNKKGDGSPTNNSYKPTGGRK